MFRNSLFANDPFFSGHMESMRHMERSMDAMMNNLMDPFGFFGGAQQPAIGYTGYERDYDRRGERQVSRQLAHRPRHPTMFDGLFGGFGMMPNMHNMMQQQMLQAQTDPNSAYYSQSSVMSYQNTGDGRPRIYQASTSQGQTNGVQETRRSVRDSAEGIEKISIARQMGDKTQKITKERNVTTGDIEEDKELVNLDEDEEDQFNAQFRQHMGRSNPYHPAQYMMVGNHLHDNRRQPQPQAQPLAIEPAAVHQARHLGDRIEGHPEMPRRDGAQGRHERRNKKPSPKKQKNVRF